MNQNYLHGVGNKLLAAISREEYNRLLPNFEFVTLSLKQPLHNPHEFIEYVYFFNSGIASVLIVMSDGSAVEVATIGNEGMVGIPVLLGGNRYPAEVIVQVPGNGLRMKVDVFKNLVTPGSVLHNLLLRYTQVLFNMLAQSVACNRLHSLEERCCRWLLLTHDRVDSDEFPLTQEFLSEMLGVRRASVSVVAAILQKAGLIRYHRGKITILDRQGLEAGSCECYQIIKDEFDRCLN